MCSFNVPDSVAELLEKTFSSCTSLRSCQFSEHCVLKTDWRKGDTFKVCGQCGLESSSIPYRVCELMEIVLARMRATLMLGGSLLNSIGAEAFCGCGLGSFCMPDDVEFGTIGCFRECQNLSDIRSGPQSVSSCAILLNPQHIGGHLSAHH